MGVMSCSRRNCENIMCDTYINSVGYVCYECQNEFVKLFPQKYSEDKLVKRLMKFIDTTKNVETGDTEGGIYAYDFFNKNTE